jgi:coenzyme F420 hydrogenase subunit beta
LVFKVPAIFFICRRFFPMRLAGPNQLLESVFARDLCIGCGACVDLCPYFKTYSGRTAQVFPCTRETGRCFAFCPKVEVDYQELSQAFFNEPYRGAPLGHYLRVVKVEAGPNLPKGNYQNSGAVTALAVTALETGMISAAVVTDRKGLMPVPKVVNKKEDIIACAASKYTAAPTLAAANRAAADGAKDLGLIGTPCQITAAAMSRLNPTEKEGFSDPYNVLIGLFCTWAVDARKLAALIAGHTKGKDICKMDMPPPPSAMLVLSLDDCNINVGLDLVRPIVPKGCSVCPDMTSEYADISVGVLEGLPLANTVIVRTPRGQELLDQALERGYLVAGKVAAENLAHLSLAANNKKKRALAAVQALGDNIDPEADGRAVFRIRAEALERIMAGV